MADELFTRCPGCKTIFRVTEPQLALRDGQVRCGHCRTVFNGREELIALDAPALDDEEPDELAAGRRPSRCAARIRSIRRRRATRRRRRATTCRRRRPADYENRFAWERRRSLRARPGCSRSIAIPVLAIALVLQALFHFRDALAAHMPSTKPTLTRLCAMAGCSHPPAARRGGAVHRRLGPAGRPRAPRPAGPHGHASATARATRSAIRTCELTLTDASDQVVVRRALAPSDYVERDRQHRGGHLGQRRSAGEALHRRQRHDAGRLPAVPVLPLSRTVRGASAT